MSDSIKKFQQPWMHSPILDTIGMYGLPLLLCLLFLLFKDHINYTFFYSFSGLIAFIDYSHGYASWAKVSSNPMENKKSVIFYILIYIIFAIIFIPTVYFKQVTFIHNFLVYYAIYHFMRQQWAIIKIYDRGMTKKNKNLVQNIFIYSSMLYPILWWHTHINENVNFYWKNFFITIPFVDHFATLTLITLIFSALIFAYNEIRLSFVIRNLNIPKNLTILATVIGWNYAIIFSDHIMVFFFGVVYAHNISYFFIVWITANRDFKLQGYPKTFYNKFINWKSNFGFPLYFIVVCLVATSFISFVNKVTRGSNAFVANMNFKLDFLPILDNDQFILKSIIIGLYLATHAGQFTIDAFLWRKEKNYALRAR